MLSPGMDASLQECKRLSYLWVVRQVDLPGDVVYCTYPLFIFLPALCLENYSPETNKISGTQGLVEAESLEEVRPS